MLDEPETHDHHDHPNRSPTALRTDKMGAAESKPSQSHIFKAYAPTCPPGTSCQSSLEGVRWLTF